MKIRTSKEFLTLTQLTKLHDSNLNVCHADTRFNVSTVDTKAKVHSRRKLELNKDDLLEFFDQKGYAVAFNRQNQAVQHLMPYDKNKATDFATLLKSQLTKYIKKQYPRACGLVFHFDETVPHVHIFFADIDTTNTTTHQLKHSKSNDDNKQQTQEANSKQQAQTQQEQLLQQQLRQRQVQIAINIANEQKKKKREKQRQARIKCRRRLRKQQDDLEP